jgi:predicted N-acetyltransferase YhbS
MNTKQVAYNPEQDFLRVRDFLVATFGLTERPLNWRLERWNYARWFVSPMLADYGRIEPDPDAYQQAIRLWDDVTGLWENAAGDIVGVANIEHTDPSHGGWGEVFLQHHPAYDELLPEMLAYAEQHLRNQERNLVYLPVYDHDLALLDAVQSRGYERIEKHTLWDAVIAASGAQRPNFAQLPDPLLPPGYRLQSMADNNDLERRRKAFGQGFNHPEPENWPSRLAYQELQKAPDYRPELDLYVVAPDGEFVSFCIVWWDAHNRIASLEPVGTIPEERRKGLAQAVVLEGVRRAAELGAQRVFVGSDQEFYLTIGFELQYASHHWVKRF